MLTVPRITILGRLLRIGWGVVKADIRAVPGATRHSAVLQLRIPDIVAKITATAVTTMIS